MAKLKTQITNQKVLDFVEAIDHERKKTEAYELLDMMKEITGMEPRMWGPSIIGYGSYHYKYESGHEGDAAILSFSPRKAKHVLYVLNNFEGQEALLEKLGKFKTGSVCLYVNKLADVDMEVLKEISTACFEHCKANYPWTKT
ncbi:MAG: DUF1801 domain-containing protein [Bacteroidota bacterium]